MTTLLLSLFLNLASPPVVGCIVIDDKGEATCYNWPLEVCELRGGMVSRCAPQEK